MKKKILNITIVATLLLVLLTTQTVLATSTPSKTYNSSVDFLSGVYKNISIYGDGFAISDTPGSSDTAFKYNSMIFTIADIIIFGYEDNTDLFVYDSAGQVVWQGTLNQGQSQSLRVAQGVYKVSGNEKFTVLSGDPIAQGVVGFYSMDKNGYGAGQELYTYVPILYGSCRFAVFAFEDNTDVLVKNTLTNTPIWEGTLNKGEHWAHAGLASTWITVLASSDVSALTCYDQSYYVPSTNKLWSGVEFYTYVGNTVNWPHDLTVISAYDDNYVKIYDSDTNAIIWEGVLQKDEFYVQRYPSGANKFVTINCDKVSVVSVQPWVSQTTNYHQGTYVPDVKGSGIGREFYATSLTGGYVYILGYTDNTKVSIYNLQTGDHIRDYVVDKDKYVNINPGNGIWKVVSNNAISIYSGFGEANAGFAPVEFGEAVIPQNGVWSAIFNSAQDDTEWGYISWDANIPTNANVEIFVSTSTNGVTFSDPIFVTNGDEFNLFGRYIKIDVQLRRSSDGESPFVSRITVSAKGPEWVETDKSDGYGTMIPSNAHSYDAGSGVVFYWDEKQKDDGVLVVPDEFFETYGQLTVVVKSSNEYRKLIITHPGDYEITKFIDAKGMTKNINMVWIRFDANPA
ncbi:MAG: hypothetical protein LBI79_08220 [Nitrososphaerota archaeon]|jgi:hypothetical protein|nr:hypothetical protein [Nitrososphaerota archaeon]